MKKTFLIPMMIAGAWATAHAQVQPAATGPGLPPILYKFNYTANYSEDQVFSNSMGQWQMDILSGQVSYRNGKERLPFSLAYSGGYTWIPIGLQDEAGFFETLGLGQEFNTRKMSWTLSDNVSYRPNAPTSGFSGIAGTGEPITGSGSTGSSTESVLTLSTHTVDNAAGVNLDLRATSATTISFGGGSVTLDYPDGNALDTNSEMANAGISHRIDARNTISGQYQFSQFSYPGFSFTFSTNSWELTDEHAWTRKFETTLSAGPEVISSSDNAMISSPVELMMTATVSYHSRFDTASLSYDRGVNGGSGFDFGAENDSITGTYARRLGKTANLELMGAYRRTARLLVGQNIDSETAGAQATRRMGRHFTAFAGYSAINQSSNSSLPSNALNDLLQTVSFGLGYSLRAAQPAQ